MHTEYLEWNDTLSPIRVNSNQKMLSINLYLLTKSPNSSRLAGTKRKECAESSCLSCLCWATLVLLASSGLSCLKLATRIISLVFWELWGGKKGRMKIILLFVQYVDLFSHFLKAVL